MGEVGEIGRTPIPVAESTRHPGERFLPSVKEHDGGEPGRVGGTTTLTPRQGEAVGETQGRYEGEKLSGHCQGPQIHEAHQRQRQGERGRP